MLRTAKRAFAEVLTQEMGKITTEAAAEVELSAEILNYFADRRRGRVHGEIPGPAWPYSKSATFATQPPNSPR